MMAKRDPKSVAATVSLAGARVAVDQRADQTARFAAQELSRFLYLLTGKMSPVVHAVPQQGSVVVLGGKAAKRLGVKAPVADLGEQGYRLHGVQRGRQFCLVVNAPRSVGLLYGVYGLLAELGMGFYAGGETYPDLPTRALIPTGINQTQSPAFAVRGNMLHYNFLCGPTDWGLEDYKFYFDCLARQRCNMLLMHWYDGEPGAASEVQGEYVTGGPTPNSLTRPWGAIDALRTSEFSFGSGKYFDAEIFSSPPGEGLPDLLTEVKRSEELFSRATEYARVAGIEVAAGWELPHDAPTDPVARRRFLARLEQFVERNPHLSRLALWQHESAACVGIRPPAEGAAKELYEAQAEHYRYLGAPRRIWAAIVAGAWADVAARWLLKNRPDLPMVLVGWGGNRWMRFSDLCLAWDKLLPHNVAFTCHDNIDASFGPEVSDGWGQLSPRRERWAMPWVEGDIDECWVRQPNVESLGKLAPDALRKGCQGLLTLQWRTRDVEEETGFIAQYAWDTTLTPARFYDRLARHQFGPRQEKAMGRMLGALQKAGARWTGVRGTVECSGMLWTGNVPHYPFDLDATAPAYLIPMADHAADMLSLIPEDETDPNAGAFHLRPDSEDFRHRPRDPQRLGVAVLRAAAQALRELEGETNETALRAALVAQLEAIWPLRDKLIAAGMSIPCYRALDSFLIAMHHLQRNAGASHKIPQLRRFRRRLAGWRTSLDRGPGRHRLERLDFLAATMDFVLHYDTAAMLLADGEAVDQALAKADAARAAGDTAGAAAAARDMYATLVAAGMAGATAALTRKLTTRCDYGVLTTFNLKPLPLYWQTIGRLEEFMPAVPPRQVLARGGKEEVWLSWKPSGKGAGQRLYRRPADQGKWVRVGPPALAAGCNMFVDHPARPGEYDYAVSALAEDHWESPFSHPVPVSCGRREAKPRFVAAKPASRLLGGEDLRVQVVVDSPQSLQEVVLLWRSAGATSWRRAAMVHRFRDSYGAVVSAEDLPDGLVEFFAQAKDVSGNTVTWPQTGAALPWTVVVR